MFKTFLKKFFGLAKEGLPTRFDDVSLLYNHPSNLNSTSKSTEEFLELRLHMKTVILKKAATLKETAFELKKAFPYMTHIQFFDVDMIPYHYDSLFEFISKTDFIIKINNTSNFMIVNENIDFKEIFQNEKEKEDWEIKELVEGTNRIGISSKILTEFISSLAAEIQKDPNRPFTLPDIQNIIKSKIQNDALHFHKKKAFYDNLINFLNEQIQLQKGMENLLIQKNERRALLSLRALSLVVLLQLGFTQYGSYIGYSWDIIEPMVCLFGSIDIFCAYGYWYFFKINFDYQRVFQKRLQKLKERDLNYKKVADNEYERVLKVVRRKRAFLSSDPLRIIESFHEGYAGIHYGQLDLLENECDKSEDE